MEEDLVTEILDWLDWLRSPEGMGLGGLIDLQMEIDLGRRRFREAIDSGKSEGL